jgi:glycosyltransferase involved in cell wall biosynthesis
VVEGRGPVDSAVLLKPPAPGADDRVDEPPAAAPARPLRVAQVVTKLTAGAGGITLRGAAALDPSRYRTTIFTAEGGSLISAAEASGLRVVELRHMTRGRGVYPGSDLRGLRELVALLKAGRFDVVHTHSAKAGALGRIAAQRVGVPAIVHSYHGFPFHEFQSRPVRRALLEAERRLARITDYFLTDGTMVAAQAVRLRLAPPDRVRAIVSPVDDGIPPATAETRRRARALLGISGDARVIGTAARLDRQKAPLDLVQAVAALGRPDVVLVWLGDGELRSEVERAVRRAGLEGRVVLAGERSDVPALLPAFDVFAMSSLYEGLPCAVLEAMVCGIPVVATAVNSVPEVVLSGRTGLLARPRDPNSLAAALAFMLDHPGDAARMARTAREAVRTGCRPDVHARDLDDAYRLALEGAHVRRVTRGARDARVA